jgi:hypothetical protein
MLAQLSLDAVLRLHETVTQTSAYRPLRSFGGLHQCDSPLQGGLGCFQQLAEHLRP